MKIDGSIGNFTRFTVEGVAGRFSCRTIRHFTKVDYWAPGRPPELVCNVPVGNYQSPGIAAVANPDWESEVLARVESFIERKGCRSQ